MQLRRGLGLQRQAAALGHLQLRGHPRPLGLRHGVQRAGLQLGVAAAELGVDLHHQVVLVAPVELAEVAAHGRALAHHHVDQAQRRGGYGLSLGVAVGCALAQGEPQPHLAVGHRFALGVAQGGLVADALLGGRGERDEHHQRHGGRAPHGREGFGVRNSIQPS